MSPPCPTPSTTLSDYVEVSEEKVPNQISVEPAEKPEPSENEVHKEWITCATDCYHTFSDAKQRFASAQAQWPLVFKRLNEETEYLESTRSLLDDDSEGKTKKQVDDLNTTVNKKRDLILGLRSLLRTFDATDLE
ncbi:hypothetical protein CEP54_005260 [Fusarium duplospermum]|uniref:Uncharacterized protein n=1 Tax=Fusarium duplospermum TaxID=1325734 RepID=A0A428QDZ8_9HYPO|nr:hypothetical protein CEP54_005260 [Fusarium duplospermum]